MNRYGQPITWGTIAAPQLFTGICTAYSYRNQLQRMLDEDMAGDNRALVQHSKKADVSFDAKVTEGTTDFLDLSAGAAVAVSGINTGVVLASRVVERWTLGNPKTASFQGTHYPDITQANPDLAGITLDAFTPDQSALAFLYPGGKLIWGTYGLTHLAGVLHMVEVAQQLTLSEDEVNPDGTIKGCTAHGYLRTINLDILTLTTGTVPLVGSELAIGGAENHMLNYRIESAETKFVEKRGKMLSLGAVWIPPLTA